MRLSILVALAENGVIGRDGDLPWRLPDDLRRFKSLTTGHAILMGRKTYLSIGRPLPKRRNVVLSRDRTFGAEIAGIEMADSLDSALDLVASEEEVFVVGGAALYAEALPRADRLHLTRVHAEVEGDVYFPALDLTDWNLIERQHRAADDRHAHAFTFEVWDRDTAPESVLTPGNGAAEVLGLAEIDAADVAALLERYGFALRVVAADAPIPGSFWGEPEAGVVSSPGRRPTVTARGDTPVHSLLHEACHLVCMDAARRASVHTDAGCEDVAENDAEENAILYLQVLLGGELGDVGRERIFADMDRWGYSFRLGSARAWFEKDAEDAQAWLVERGILDRAGALTWKLREL